MIFRGSTRFVGYARFDSNGLCFEGKILNIPPEDHDDGKSIVFFSEYGQIVKCTLTQKNCVDKDNTSDEKVEVKVENTQISNEIPLSKN